MLLRFSNYLRDLFKLYMDDDSVQNTILNILYNNRRHMTQQFQVR
uniref:Uncharacterized protein n=1 Tax=Schistosoma haematobium TaxID=6185 RepID=A0A094ZJE9_SCHHA